jgi:hypothetical protein
MTGEYELLDEGRAHIAGADDGNFHDLSFGECSDCCDVRTLKAMVSLINGLGREC